MALSSRCQHRGATVSAPVVCPPLDPPWPTHYRLFQTEHPAFILVLALVLVPDPPAAFDYDYEADNEDD
jgi:hypothetical protein